MNMTIYDVIERANALCNICLNPHNIEIKDAVRILENKRKEAKAKLEELTEAVNFLKCFEVKK